MDFMEDNMHELDKILSNYKGEKSDLIPLLQDIQSKYGYLSEELMGEVSKFTGVKEGETTPDGEYSLESVACLGCCALAPAAMVDDEIKSKLSLRGIKKLFRGYNPKN
jgi:NADH-quinone oxidoreductase subunit E